MKYLIIISILLTSLYSRNIELNLKQFAELVSSQHMISIVLDDSIKSDNFAFFIQRHNYKILLPAFKKMLSLKKLKLHYDKEHNFYYIDKLLPPQELKKYLYTIKLDTLVYDDLKPILEQFEDLKYSYIKNSNSIMLYTTKKLYSDLYKIISNNDDVLEQFQLKITVIETNLKNAKERGVEINTYTQKTSGDLQFFLNLITMPLTAETNIFSNSISGFTASLNFLDSLGVTNITASPSMTVQSGKNIYFSSVENIPYLVSNSSVTGASQSNTEQIVYKDVGLKVNLTPNLINDIVFIDLKFTIETLIGESSKTPTTAKRELNNSFQLKRGQILVLSGLDNVEKSNSTYGIPLLMKLPYIGQIFRFDTETKTKKSLSIMIEII